MFNNQQCARRTAGGSQCNRDHVSLEHHLQFDDTKFPFGQSDFTVFHPSFFFLFFFKLNLINEFFGIQTKVLRYTINRNLQSGNKHIFFALLDGAACKPKRSVLFSSQLHHSASSLVSNANERCPIDGRGHCQMTLSVQDATNVERTSRTRSFGGSSAE